MSASDFFFYLFSAGAILGSLYLLIAKTPMKAAFGVLFVFLCTGLIYLSKGLNFLAAAQIIIYAGAIMSLFAVALPAMSSSQRPEKPRIFYSTLALAAAFAIFLVFGASLFKLTAEPYAPFPVSTKDLAIVIFKDYWLQIELVSMILFAALAAAYVFLSGLGRKA